MENRHLNDQMKYLVDQAKQGSREAFCELYGIYKDKLYRYAYYKLGDPDEAEDAVSDCVLSAWQGIGRLNSSNAFSTWLFRILSNCCAKAIRDKIMLRERMEHIYEKSPTVAQDASLSVELSEALGILSDDERDVVLLATVGGMTSREISEVTGLTAGAARSKLSRSLTKMRNFLEPSI